MVWARAQGLVLKPCGAGAPPGVPPKVEEHCKMEMELRTCTSSLCFPGWILSRPPIDKLKNLGVLSPPPSFLANESSSFCAAGSCFLILRLGQIPTDSPCCSDTNFNRRAQHTPRSCSLTWRLDPNGEELWLGSCLPPHSNHAAEIVLPFLPILNTETCMVLGI